MALPLLGSLAAISATVTDRIDALLDPSSFNPAFYRDNFAGQGSCGGSLQSPIELPGGITPALGSERTTLFRMPAAITGATIENKGTGTQISWDPRQFDLTRDEFPLVQVGPGATGIASSIQTYDPNFPSPAERTLTMVPVQMHWHVVSEHSLDGRYTAMEAHIVTFVAPNQATEWGCDSVWFDDLGPPNLENCIAVFGMTYELGPSSPSFISAAVASAGNLQAFGDKTAYPGTLNLNAVLPAAKSHYTYPGSLTTPPCAETLLWHVFDSPGSITAADQIALEQMVAQTFDSSNPNVKNDYRHNNRPVQPRNNRPVYFGL
eukprot:jgi/Ulvmu1/1188/UM108_0016.1